MKIISNWLPLILLPVTCQVFSQTSQPYWPFERPPIEALRASSKKVFAVYMPQFPISDAKNPKDDSYERYFLKSVITPWGADYIPMGGYTNQRPILPIAPVPDAGWKEYYADEEIRRAVDIGLDGFIFEVIGVTGPFWDRWVTMLDAAQRVDPDFKIMLMPDVASSDVAEVIRKSAKHPSTYKINGKIAIFPFLVQREPASYWQDLITTLKNEGIGVALIGMLSVGWLGNLDESPYTPVIVGVSDWGTRTPDSAAAYSAAAVDSAHKKNLIVSVPIGMQDTRPKERPPIYWEARNSETYRAWWKSAIESGADWVNIVCWNDYGESVIAPSTGIGWSLYDLTAYYITWFKTGTPPPINKDILYYFHRVQPTTANYSPLQTAGEYKLKGGGAACNDIELLAFLTAPGTLEIEIANTSQSFDVEAGVSSLKVPIKAGKPVFRLVRDTNEIFEFKSDFEIRDSVTFQDMLYRSGSSSRTLNASPVPLSGIN